MKAVIMAGGQGTRLRPLTMLKERGFIDIVVWKRAALVSETSRSRPPK